MAKKVTFNPFTGTFQFLNDATSLTVGTEDQIPYMNAAGDDFDYSAGFTYDGSTLTVNGTISGDEIVSTSGGVTTTLTSESFLGGSLVVPEIQFVSSGGNSGFIRNGLAIRGDSIDPFLGFYSSDVFSQQAFITLDLSENELEFTSADLYSFDADISIIDNKKILFGTAQDASIYYDGTNLQINPQEVGTGGVVISGANFPVVKVERTTTGTGVAYATINMKGHTSANMVEGFGSSLLFSVEDSASVNNNIGYVAGIRQQADDEGAIVIGGFKDGSQSRAAIPYTYKSTNTDADVVSGYFPNEFYRSTSATAGQSSGFRLSTVTDGNMSDGFGGGFLFGIADRGNYTPANINNIAGVYGQRDGADNSGSIGLNTWLAGSRTEWLTVRSDGTVQVNADSQKLTFGAAQDFEIFFDGSYGRLDATGESIYIGDDTTNALEIKNNGTVEPHGTATYNANGGNAGLTQSETGVTDFDVVIEDGLITSFTKNN